MLLYRTLLFQFSDFCAKLQALSKENVDRRITEFTVHSETTHYHFRFLGTLTNRYKECPVLGNGSSLGCVRVYSSPKAIIYLQPSLQQRFQSENRAVPIDPPE